MDYAAIMLGNAFLTFVLTAAVAVPNFVHTIHFATGEPTAKLLIVLCKICASSVHTTHANSGALFELQVFFNSC